MCTNAKVHRLAFAGAVAILQLAGAAAAFAPPPSALRSFPATSTSSATLLNAKKRRKSPGPDADAAADQNITEGINQAVDAVEANEGEDAPQQTTLSGGSSLIFEMARRMLVWDDELYESGMLNDAGSRDGEGASSPSIPTTQSPSALPPIPSPASSSLPRWRPSAIRQQSISNSNPSFRTSAPVMTNAGYAGILRRNSRKRRGHNRRVAIFRGVSSNGSIG